MDKVFYYGNGYIVFINRFICEKIIQMKILLIMLLLAGCATTETKYIKARLSHDPRPTLPKISSDELKCLNQSTYQKLYDRERLIHGWAVGMETTIDSTGGNDGN